MCTPKFYHLRLVGVVGEHGDFPIEAIRRSHDEKFMASCSHDQTVKFWDIAFLFEDDGNEEDAMDTAESVQKDGFYADM